jgi:hypothetical protein
VRIGGLLLAARATPDGPLRPAVSGEFSSDTLDAYLEIYSEAEEQLKNTTVVVEVAPSEDSRALDSSKATFHTAEGTGKRTAEASVVIALLPPGEYVARAVVTVFGRKAGQVVRPFRIVRRSSRFANE